MKTGMSFGDVQGGGGNKSKRSSHRDGGAISTSAFPLADSHELRYQEHQMNVDLAKQLQYDNDGSTANFLVSNWQQNQNNSDQLLELE